MPDDEKMRASQVPCCPELDPEPCCERLQFRYTLENRRGDIPVEIGFIFELERCPTGLALGDIVYSTTLLPGEKVRLYSNNRHSRFTYDATSEVSYKHENSSDESFYMQSMDTFMSDLTINDSGNSSSTSSGEASATGSTSGPIQTLIGGGKVKASGNYSAQSASDFAREISSHASASHDRSVSATRALNSMSVGEVSSRTHAEGESESAYEASTRILENKNQCHAVNYFAYQLVKKQTVKFRVKAVTRRVIDPAGNSEVLSRPRLPNAEVTVIPSGVLATNTDRLQVQQVANASVLGVQPTLINANTSTSTAALTTANNSGIIATNINRNVLRDVRPAAVPMNIPVLAENRRASALRAVDSDLQQAGVLDQAGNVAPEFAAEIAFEQTTCIPTQAIMVKGCLDECNVCEDSLVKSIELDLENKSLQNKLLERQIELLDKAQEYRCCPEGEKENETEDA